MLQDYMKAVPLLTISSEGKLKTKVQQLEVQQSRQIAQQASEIQALRSELSMFEKKIIHGVASFDKEDMEFLSRQWQRMSDEEKRKQIS